MKYRIEKIGYSYEVQKWGVVMLDGCLDYMWKTIARFWDEDEAERYLAEVAR